MKFPPDDSFPDVKSKLKYYIELSKETMKKTTDLLELERLQNNLSILENQFVDVLSLEYCFNYIDINN